MRENYQTFLIRDWQPGDRAIAAEVIRSVLTEYGLGWEPGAADRDVLEIEPGDLGHLIRADRPKRLPVVLSRDEVRRILAALNGPRSSPPNRERGSSADTMLTRVRSAANSQPLSGPLASANARPRTVCATVLQHIC